MGLGLFFSFIWNSVSLVLFSGAGCSWLIPRKFKDRMLSNICAPIFPILWKILVSFSPSLKIFWQRSKSETCLVLIVCACVVSDHYGAVTDFLVQTNNQGLYRQVSDPLETILICKSDPVMCSWALKSMFLVLPLVCVIKFQWKEQKPCN